MTTTITQSQDLKPPTLNVRGLRKTCAGGALKSVHFDPMSGEITVGCIALMTT
ncbi:hypothetical protein RLEG3_03195 (plasmid) [Rhizobium leguminosarum bv. trifolii WSM1689]|uniref:hypothetical protein n=1 Tax=Rhizobium leguminosarum TaxID=384 RepID=UPI0003E0A23A|nr:hypothetical protein [Rhizobium leguminosarum]AHF88107.1 hypothetical protein RLEG3_03195 [Rhizobium leguminosarum bv. trifolii WSM1689]